MSDLTMLKTMENQVSVCRAENKLDTPESFLKDIRKRRPSNVAEEMKSHVPPDSPLCPKSAFRR